MNRFRNILLLLAGLIALVIFKNRETLISGYHALFQEEYAFFVAGHVYGHPQGEHPGFHPPFVNAISYINNYEKMQFGVLTGDIVRKRKNPEHWKSSLVDIDKFSHPIHVAAGNHDRSKRFLEHFDQYFHQFKFNQDLFIILSPTRWNIEGAQKEFLISTIENNYQEVNNIFIFCHELIWWAPDNEFQNVEINFKPQYPGSSNYWNEISPILKSVPNNVILFAGDLGATKSVSSHMYYVYDNIQLIGSGMGGGKEDNMILVEVNTKGIPKFRMIGLNETPYVEMGRLEDYVLP